MAALHMDPHVSLTYECWTLLKIMLYAYVLVHIELLLLQLYAS